jgi:outer membrane lipoprotein-sorting protein
MSGFRFRRWGVPALLAVGVAGASAAPHAFADSPSPDLPALSAAQLLAAIKASNVHAFSGTVQTVANLGLPQVPDRLVAVGSGLPALLSGAHMLRVWADGADRQRIALLGDLSETDVIHNGSDLWTYASTSNAVTHRKLPSPADRADPTTPARPPGADAADLTPQVQAERTLAKIDPTTTVTVEDTARVAGRPVYRLTLIPRSADTLVRSVRIAVDAATAVPLQVQIYAASSTAPAWQTGFTHVAFSAPSSKVFDFTPPAHATVTDSASPSPAARPDTATDEHLHPTTTGQGWASILVLPPGSIDAVPLGADGPSARRDGNTSMLDRLTTSVPEGRLLTTRLFSALITPDGRVFLGAVPPAAVRQAAARAGS